MAEGEGKCRACNGPHEHYQCPHLFNKNWVQGAKIEELLEEVAALKSLLGEAEEMLDAILPDTAAALLLRIQAAINETGAKR